MILITGATGKIGSAVLRRLAGTVGPTVRALVRDPARVTDDRPAGTEIVVGDFAAPRTLDDAMAGVHKVLLTCMPRFEDAGSAHELQEKWLTLEGNAIDAARRAGVAAIVRISAIANHPIHAVIDERLQASGISSTILCPSVFMQNMFSLAPKLKSDDAVYAPAWGPQGLIDVEDIAAAACVALSDDSLSGKRFDLTGPENLTYADIAACFSAVLGRQIRYLPVPAERWCRSWPKGSQWYAKLLSDRYSAWAEHAPPLSNSVRALTGRSPRKFADWVRANVTAFA